MILNVLDRGGPGTERRKIKERHANETAHEEKQLQSTFRKLGINPVSNMERIIVRGPLLPPCITCMFSFCFKVLVSALRVSYRSFTIRMQHLSCSTQRCARLRYLVMASFFPHDKPTRQTHHFLLHQSTRMLLECFSIPHPDISCLLYGSSTRKREASSFSTTRRCWRIQEATPTSCKAILRREMHTVKK